MKYNTFEEALTDLGWYHIDNFEVDNKSAIDQINEILNLSAVPEPKIVTDKKTVIICDNHDFNETYVIDLVSSSLKAIDTKPGDYQLVYIDNVTARQYIDNPKYIQYHTNASDDELKVIERNTIKPKVIVINPEADSIVAVSETEITQITQEAVDYIIKYLITDFALKEKSKQA